MTAHLNPASERRKQALIKQPSSTQVPESTAPQGGRGRGRWLLSWERGCRGRVTLSTARSPSPFHLLIYSLDQHMAPIPALHSTCHNALTLIGLMYYSIPLALRRFYWHSTLVSVGSITRAFLFIKMPRHHTKITEISLTTGWFG